MNLKKSSFVKNPEDVLQLVIGLPIATARLNSRLRFSDLSSRELWTRRNQFTHEQLPFSDSPFILAKHELRSSNYAFSEKSKNPSGRAGRAQ